MLRATIVAIIVTVIAAVFWMSWQHRMGGNGLQDFSASELPEYVAVDRHVTVD